MIHRVLGRSGVILIAVAVALSDQLSKAWITDVLSDGRSLQAVPGLLDLRWCTTPEQRSACCGDRQRFWDC